MKCPRCGIAASGSFCATCGTALSAVSCRRCGSALPDAACFCTQCGAAVRPGFAFPIPLIALGLAAILAVAAGAYWLGTRGREAEASVVGAPLDAPGTMGATGGSPPALTGSMREQADRLFERIMQARARGDVEEVRFFMPMALTAYESVTDQDADGLFHHGLLLVEADRAEEARALADRIRALNSSHLFGLALRAEAALAAGDTTAASSAFGEYLDRFDGEIATDAREYQVHRPALDEYRAQARLLTRR